METHPLAAVEGLCDTFVQVQVNLGENVKINATNYCGKLCQRHFSLGSGEVLRNCWSLVHGDKTTGSPWRNAHMGTKNSRRNHIANRIFNIHNHPQFGG